MDDGGRRYEGLLSLVERVLETRTQGALRRVMIDAFAGLGVTYFRLLHVSPTPIDGTRFVEVLTTIPDDLSMRALAERYPNMDDVMFSLIGDGGAFDTRHADAGAFQDQYLKMRDEHTARVGLKAYYAVPVHTPDRLDGLAIFLFDKPDDLDRAEKLAFRVLAKAAIEQARGLGSPSAPPPECPLTRRQREALSHCAHGKSDWDIAAIMGISQTTVHGHIEDAKKRLGVKTRIQAVIAAMRYGWIDA